MTSDYMVYAQGWGLMSKSSTCSKCGISVSKFSRGPYLDKHLSETIHSLTIGTLQVLQVVFLLQNYLEVYILTNIYQKAFIHSPYVPCRVLFHSITSDPRFMARGGARGQNLVHF